MPAPELIREDLARAGASPAEAAELARLLERAAEPSRFAVSPAEAEVALERARSARPRRTLRAGLPRLAAVGAGVAVVAAALMLFAPSQQPGVEARALDALGDEHTLLRVRMTLYTRVPGVASISTREGWLDPSRGRARWTQLGEDGSVVAETLVEPRRFERSLAYQGVTLAGTSCTSFAAGCAELIDPVTRYREALGRSDVRAARSTFGGRDAYRLILPLQGSIDQVVFVDRETYLPRLIEWRERQGSGRRVVVSTIEISDVERVDREDVRDDVFALPASGRVVRVRPAGALRATRPLTVREARPRRPFWLGPRGLTALEERRYQRGSVLVARYGDRELWTYGSALPRELLVRRLAQTKVFESGGTLVTLFELDGRLAIVREGAGRSLAVVAPARSKEELVALLLRARTLR